MICRLTGQIVAVTELAAIVETGGGLCYELLIPRSAQTELAERGGAKTTFHTFQYIEGNPAGSNFIPRLLGFVTETDRSFFLEFTKVKGVGMRKALRAMALPAHQIAAAIERGDERTLTGLPEIGKKLAAQMCTELRGKLERFQSSDSAVTHPVRTLSAHQQVAIEILVNWGDRRGDAERLVSTAVEENASLSTPEDIVRAAYRLKQLSGR